MINSRNFVLKIKESRWDDFKEKSTWMGFRKFYLDSCLCYGYDTKDADDDMDYMLVVVCDSDRTISYESNKISSPRYSSEGTDGEEFVVIYRLIEWGYIEMVERVGVKSV